ncbi:precorrin-6Y methyltransferase [Methylobacterium platani JCM 14648]|uniref:Precorrin-6Y methyltransferase n=1 Tax=Methylobacterium platani JCM 14648 TaxID=1295136 RepID=A0ABR5H5P5_9HYPH|nr:precorrin-6Y methyltransferase [Methylobacterium platani JCM 14648]
MSSAAPFPGPWLSIVGIGEDGRAGLSPAAAAALDGAGLVIGGRRHLDLAAPLAAATLAWPSPLSDAYPAILARRGQPTCVLATGDPFHYGVGAELARLVPAGEILAYPQASAFSLAAARLGWPLAEVACLTLHGRALERVIPHLQPGARLLALSWDGSTPGKLAALLTGRGFPRSRLTVLEAMGGPRERRRTGLAAEFSEHGIDPLNTIAVEVAAEADARVIPLTPGLDDAWFENDGQLTKAEIRAVTLAALRPRAGQRLWDVGAGSGSVGIEWSLRHPANRAVAIEAREERAARIRRNAAHLGVPDLQVVVGRAPESLAGLPAPDAAFIGGGVFDPALVAAVLGALPSGGRLVANAVTLESEALLLRLRAERGGTLRRLSVARAEPVGPLTGWRTAMPVTQWALTKP